MENNLGISCLECGEQVVLMQMFVNINWIGVCKKCGHKWVLTKEGPTSYDLGGK